MEQTRANLTALPIEILSQILDHLLPKGQVFRIKSQRKRVPKSAARSRVILRPEVYWYSWTTKQHHTWHVGKPVVCPGMLSILLIHPAVYRLALPSLYANNTLWFPDAQTFREFASRFSPQARSAIRTLAVNACGEALGFHGSTASETIFEHEADITLAATILQFPNLNDLRLGGVGPGLLDRVRWSETETRTYERPRVDGVAQMVTLPPGPIGVMPEEDEEYWSLDGIALVAKLTDSDPQNEVEDNLGSNQTSRDHITDPGLIHSPLTRGRVFCHKVEKRIASSPMGRAFSYSGFNQEGIHRHVGTRIVKWDLPVVLGDYEMEVTDVSQVLREAKVEDDRKKEMQRRIDAGEYRNLVSPGM